MFAPAALFAHIQQTLFNVEMIEPSGHFSHDVPPINMQCGVPMLPH
jgi:hypothetical protein